MPDLPEVQQEFTAETAGYVAGLEEAIAVSEQFAAAVQDDIDQVLKLKAALDSLPDFKNIDVNITTSGDMPDLTNLADETERQAAAAEDAAKADNDWATALDDIVGKANNIRDAVGDIPAEKTIDVKIDEPGLLAQLAEIKAALYEVFGDIPLDVDEDKVDAAIADVATKLKALTEQIPIGINEADLSTAINEIKAGLQTIVEAIPVTADNSSIITAIKVIQSNLDAAKLQAVVRSEVDQPTLGSTLNDIATAAAAASPTTDIKSVADQPTLTQALASIAEQVNALSKAQQLLIDSGLDEPSLTAALASFKAQLAAVQQTAALLKIGVQVDEPALVAAIAQLQAQLASLKTALDAPLSDANNLQQALGSDATAVNNLTNSMKEGETEARSWASAMQSGEAPLVGLTGAANSLELAHTGLAGAAKTDADAANTWAQALNAAGAPLKALPGDSNDAATTLNSLAAASNTAGNGMRILGTGMTLSANAIHWIIGVGAEILAVTVPAVIALGSAAGVALQGSVNLADGLQAVYTSTESTSQMMGITAGNVLGLKSSLQQAQDEMQPGVYEIFGSAINDAKTSLSSFWKEGEQVIAIMDQFSAKVTVDLQGVFGQQIQSLTEGGVNDLTMLGQAFGNLGHFVLNLASEMPGLAEVLLKLFSSLTSVLTALTDPAWYNFNGNLITIAMGFEEFVRWGGLAVNLFGQAAGGLSTFGAALGAAGSKFTTFVNGAKDTTTAVKDTETAIQGVSTAGQDAQTGLNALGTGMGNASNATKEATTAVKDGKTAIQDVSTAGQDAVTGLSALGGGMGTASNATKDASTALKDGKTATTDMTGAAQLAGAGLQGYGSAFSGVGTATKDATTGIKDGETATKGILTSIKDATSGTNNWKTALAFFATNPFGILIAAGAGIVGFAAYLNSAKTSSDNLADSINKTVDASKGLDRLTAIGSGIQQLNNSLVQSKQDLNDSSTAMQGLATAAQAIPGVGQLFTDLATKTQTLTGQLNTGKAALTEFGGTTGGIASQVIGLWNSFTGAAVATKSIQDTKNSMTQLATEAKTTFQVSSDVAQMTGTTLPQAMTIASEANIKWNDALQKNGQLTAQAAQQIKNLQAGYQMFDQQGSMITADIDATNFALQLQQTDVTKTNQSWDTYVKTLTGSTSSLATYNTDISEIGNVLDAVGRKFNTFSGNSAISVKQVASALTSFSGTSAQVWQNFDSAVNQGNAVMDQMRNAAAVGALSQGDYNNALKGVVAELIPYASQSKTAQDELIGLWNESGKNVTSFGQLKDQVGNVKNAQDGLNTAVVDATSKMSNLSGIVQNFSGTLQKDATDAIAKAKIGMQDLGTETENYTKQAQQSGAATGQAAQTMLDLDQKLLQDGLTTKDVTAMNMQLGAQFGLTTNQASGLANEAKTLQGGLDNAGTSTAGLTSKQIAALPQMQAVTKAMNDAHVPITTITTDENNLIDAMIKHSTNSPQFHDALVTMMDDMNNGHAPTQGQIDLVNKLTGALGKIPTNINTTITATAIGSYQVVGGYQISTGALAKPTGQHGGYVRGPGSTTSDSIPAMLSDKEYIMNASAVEHYGTGFMEAVNNMKLATGGLVRSFASGGISFTNSGDQTVLSGAYQQQKVQDTWTNLVQGVEQVMTQLMVQAVNASLATAAAAGASGLSVAFDRGGLLMPGATMALNMTGRPEEVVPAAPAGGTGGGAAGGGGDFVINVDGRELFRIMASQTYKYNIRNGGRVTGVMRPS